MSVSDAIRPASGVEAVLRPHSIAVIGAGRTRGSIGGQLFANLLEGGFGGSICAVNPSADSIQGQPAYASPRDLPEPVDMAVICVPADSVLAAAGEMIERGVGALVVVSAGFAETGAVGAALQAELVALCRQHGVRLVGPNCMGVINTAADVAMNAQFAPIAALPGCIAILSQSGALGLALVHQANAVGLGISEFVSLGNAADLADDDFLALWQADPATELVLLYLESIADPRRFARVCRRLSRAKPVIAVKSGRSAAGARATSSHTGALLGASDVTVDALFGQAGVIRTDTLADMFDVAALLSSQPLPAGRRVGIVTNGGGPGILAADACVAAGLEVPAFSERVRRQLADELPATAWVGNPIDMIASATPADYARAIQIASASAEVDALIVISGPPLGRPPTDLAATIARTAAGLPRRLTVSTVFMSTDAPRAALSSGDMVVPAYDYPENAARALGHAAAYARWRAAPTGSIRAPDESASAKAAAVLRAAEAQASERWLRPAEVRALLECYELPLVPEVSVATPTEAALAAARFGTSVALKATALSIVHKSDAHGVRLGLAGPAEVEAAAIELADTYRVDGHAVDGFVVQPMIATGVEMLVGVVHDQLFGPIVACAAGGTQAELLRDVAVRITPLTDVDAAQMVRSLATFPLLDGYRGAPRADVAALEDVLLRVSAMVEAHPDIAEMDLNPVIVLPKGAVIVDARVRIEVRP
jgi:acetyl coenzyme A synthetase (ADP forming)-like protein